MLHLQKVLIMSAVIRKNLLFIFLLFVIIYSINIYSYVDAAIECE